MTPQPPAGRQQAPAAPQPQPQQQPAPAAQPQQQPAAAAQAQPAQSAAAPPQGDGQPASSSAGPGGLAGRLSLGPKAVWAVVALVCVALGIAGSFIGARQVANNDAGDARASFHNSSATVAAAVDQMLQHEEDLQLSAATYLAGNHTPSRSEFHAWTRWLRAGTMYPELAELRVLALVPAAEVGEFTARVSGHPLPVTTTPAGATPTSPLGSRFGSSTGSSAAAAASLARAKIAPAFPIVPPGTRSHYCLALAGIARGVARRVPAGFDFCAHDSRLLATRGSGETAYEHARVGSEQALAVASPVYRGAAPPPSAGGRSAAFVGWVHSVLSPRVVLAQALRGTRVQAARLGFSASGAHFAFAVGAPRANAPSETAGLRSGWTLASFGAPISSGIFSNGHAREVLIAGALLSALLGLLVYLLGIGGSRAPAAVQEPAPAPAKPAAPPVEPGEPQLYDELTGLPGRALMLDLAERLLARVNRQSGLLAGTLLIDVDWFKDVNDKLGRDAGDQLLKIVAARLAQVVRAQDTVGRLEGDRFVVLVESPARGARLDSLARRVIEAMHKPVELDDFGPGFFVTASIGLAFGHYDKPADMLRDAGLALDAAKNGGRDSYTVFNANMHSVIEGRGVLEAELNHALQERQFSLMYQPIRDLRSGSVVALEALIRWRHPTQGVLTPSEFVPLAEETGLIVPIGRWVLEEACTRAAAWNVSGHRVGISVMVSPNQLNRDGFVTDVRRALQQSGLEPSLLTLEVAETTIMSDVHVAEERLRAVKELGVCIAIDDFGSGYAYRSDLQRMPLDYLKVDRSHLAASEDEDYRNWLLEAILLFGRDLSLTVIAKGIETEEQLAALHAMGCAMAQGYYVGEPRVTGAVEDMLAEAQERASAAASPPAAGGTATATMPAPPHSVPAVPEQAPPATPGAAPPAAAGEEPEPAA